MCVKQNDESLVRMCEDNAIEAQEDHEYILMEEEHKH
jgi:hypothetical protein